jgi:uncharacterized protein (TIGR02118 family)
MAKRFILYNLAENMTDEKFQEYVTSEKGPLCNRLPGVKKYELVKISGAMGGPSPYKYVGILHLSSAKEFDEKAPQLPEYQAFLKKFGPMAKDMIMLSGEEIY